jgi:hypothetical protein
LYMPGRPRFSYRTLCRVTLEVIGGQGSGSKAVSMWSGSWPLLAVGTPRPPGTGQNLPDVGLSDLQPCCRGP